MAAGDDELQRLGVDLTMLRAQAARDQATIEALRDQLRDHRRETQRRVRNLLSTIRSVARRTFNEGESAEEYQAGLDSRLASITRVQGYMLRQPDAGVDLATLIMGELLAFDIDLEAGAQVEGQAICLKPTAAGVLGLAFHELAHLTIEGDSTSGHDGLTLVRWGIEQADGEPDLLRIEWHDTHRGLSAASLSRSAFAHDVLEQGIPYQLKGDVDFDLVDGAVRCVVRVPVGCVMSA